MYIGRTPLQHTKSNRKFIRNECVVQWGDNPEVYGWGLRLLAVDLDGRHRFRIDIVKLPILADPLSWLGEFDYGQLGVRETGQKYGRTWFFLGAVALAAARQDNSALFDVTLTAHGPVNYLDRPQPSTADHRRPRSRSLLTSAQMARLGRPHRRRELPHRSKSI